MKSAAVAILLAAGSASAAVMYGTEAVVKEDADFGLCIPTIKYEGGLGGRSSLEFAFQAVEPLCSRGQSPATNPNIITNRICDQLSTACGANQAAKTLCRDAQTKIRVLGTHDKSTAETWNTLMGFSGALTNPDGGAAEPGAVTDLKKRQIDFIACSTEAWIDNCTGWPDVEPAVKKRSVEAPPVDKREAKPIAKPVQKRSEKAKRQVAFKPCSTEAWIDDCTGWP